MRRKLGFDTPEADETRPQLDPGPTVLSDEEAAKLAWRRQLIEGRRRDRLALRIEAPGERVGAGKTGPRIPVPGQGVA
jgi:hypothetical protein